MKRETRYDAWTKSEDDYVVQHLLEAVSQRKTSLKAFDEISEKLGRTPRAINFRWNTMLRKEHFEEYKDAKLRGKRIEKTNMDELLQRLVEQEKQLEAYKKKQEAEPVATPGPVEEPEPVGDTRYNVPKTAPNADKAQVMAEIFTNPIYFDVLKLMLNMTPEQKVMTDEQKSQVGYGLGKYPESLTASSWTIVETIEHIMSETVDKLHYLSMLKLKMIEFEEHIKKFEEEKK